MRGRVVGVFVAAGAFTVWPVLIWASFEYVPMPLGAVGALSHGAAFFCLLCLGAWLGGKQQPAPFDSPLPTSPEALGLSWGNREGEVKNFGKRNETKGERNETKGRGRAKRSASRGAGKMGATAPAPLTEEKDESERSSKESGQ